ncbi:MAG TPA: HEPN domain-containing protein [Thermoplasmata archaeon]|nr:HEPN domain-containing protein [Thermoplasmata archaeon]
MRGERKEKVAREKASLYLRKAEDFAMSMKAGLEVGAWNGATVAAIHCVISACDAVTVHALGERSRGQSHEELASLLGRLPGADQALQLRQVAAVLQLKSAVEYGTYAATRGDAEGSVKRAGRILEWARRTIGL